jgi:hypothetical protein
LAAAISAYGYPVARLVSLFGLLARGHGTWISRHLHIALAAFLAVVLPHTTVRHIALLVSLFEVLDVPKHTHAAGFFDVGINKKRGSKLIFSDKDPFGHGGKTQQQTATGYDFFHGFNVLSSQNRQFNLKNTLAVTIPQDFKKSSPSMLKKLLQISDLVQVSSAKSDH